MEPIKFLLLYILQRKETNNSGLSNVDVFAMMSLWPMYYKMILIWCVQDICIINLQTQNYLQCWIDIRNIITCIVLVAIFKKISFNRHLTSVSSCSLCALLNGIEISMWAHRSQFLVFWFISVEDIPQCHHLRPCSIISLSTFASSFQLSWSFQV